MKEERFEYDIQKRARAGTAATARAAVALYVIWLGVRIIRSVSDGSSSMSPVLAWFAGLIFITASLAFAFYTWKRWRADLEAARLSAPEDALSADDP